MDNYVITVPVEIDSKSMKESLKRQFISVKEEIEGETLKIRITADAKDLDKIRQQISQMNPKDIPRIKLDIDRANFDKHLQSMTTMAEKSASELSSIFKKNVTKGFEPLDIGELIKKQFGSTKRYSATAAKETIQELAKPLATPLDKDADYLTIVRRAEAYEQLDAAIKDMQKNHAKDFDKLGIDPKEMTQAMTDFYSQIGQMLTVDTNRENFTNQILASFETLRSNIGSMMQAIYDDAKRMGTGIGGAISDGIESGLGSGGGTGGVGQASAELDELDRQIEELSNKLKEAQDKLVSLQSGTSLSGKLSKNETSTFISAIKEDIYNSLLELEKLGDNLPFDKSQHFMQLINSFYDLGGDPAKIGSTEALINRIEEMQSRIYDLFDPNGDVDFGSIKNYVDVNAVKQQEQSITELTRRLEELKQKRESLLSASGTGASGTGGSVSVDAKPDGEKFIADLQAQIQGKSVNVETKPISDGFQQELQDKVGTINVNVKPFIESDISSAMSGWHEADQTLDNLDHGLRERIAVFNKTTGYISNTYFSDEMDEVEGDLIRHIVDTAKEQANAMIHTHPTTLAAFSPEDISLAITALGDGITQSYVMGLEDVSHIDLSSVPKEALLKIEKIFADKVKQVSDSAAAQLNSIGQGGNVLAKMALENSSEYQAKIREALLSTIEGVGLDPASILKTYSIDEFIQQFDGLPSVSQRMGEFNVKVSAQVGNIRADIEKELEQPFEVKTEISTGETSVRSKIETELAQPFDIITNADTSEIRKDIDEKIKQPPFEIDIKPTNTLVDAINEMLKANNFIIDIGANGIAMQGNGGGTSSASNPYQYIYDMMQADDWMRRRLINPNMPTKDDEIVELLKERMMLFNSKTGAHTNPYIFDQHAQTRVEQLMRDENNNYIPKDTYDTGFHSHPEVFSHMSINSLEDGEYVGDLTSFFQQMINAGIEKQIIAAQKDVQLFDAKGFFDQYMGKFATDEKQQATLAEFTKQSKIAENHWGDNIGRVIETIEYINKFGDGFKFNLGALKTTSNGSQVSDALLQVISKGSEINARDFLTYAKSAQQTSSFKDTLGGFLVQEISQIVGDAIPMQDIILGVKQALETKVKEKFVGGGQETLDMSSDILKRNFMWKNDGTQRITDVASRWITSQAWKSMGIDWDKFTEYIPMEEFKSRFSGATTQAGGVDMSKVMGESVNANINFDDVPGKLQAAIDAGAPYKVDISTDASSMQQVIQGGIDAGSPYQLTSIQLGPDMQIGEQIQQNIESFDYLVKPDLDPSSDLASKVKQALASGEPYKVIVETDTGKSGSSYKTDESPISSEDVINRLQQIITLKQRMEEFSTLSGEKANNYADALQKTYGTSDPVGLFKKLQKMQSELINLGKGVNQRIIPAFEEDGFTYDEKIEDASTKIKTLFSENIDSSHLMNIISNICEAFGINIPDAVDKAKQSIHDAFNTFLQESSAGEWKNGLKQNEIDAINQYVTSQRGNSIRQGYSFDQAQEIAKALQIISMIKFGNIEEVSSYINNATDSVKKLAIEVTESKYALGEIYEDKNGAASDAAGLRIKESIESYRSKLSDKTPVSTVPGASSSTAPVLSASAQSQQTTNDAATQEASGLEQLILKLGEVTTAIEQKTNAFSAEGQTVDGVVQQEINMLDALLGEVNMIIQDLSKLSTAITSLPEIKLEMGEIGEGSLNEQLIGFIERLQQAINQLDATKLSSFGAALKGVKVNNQHVDNMLNLAIAIEDLAEMLNKLNSGMDGSNAFSSINELIKHADQLKDLAKIISAPAKQRKAAIEQAGLDKDKANAEAEKYYDNINKYYQIQDDLNYKKVTGNTERRSLESIAEEEKLLRAIEEYEARINQKREQGIPLTEKEVAALQKRKELEKEVKERYAENVVDTKEKAVKGVQTSISVLEKNIDSFATDKEYMGQQGVVDALRGKLQEVKQLGISIENIDLVGEDDISRAQRLIDEIRKGYRNAITNKDFQIAPEKQRTGYQAKAASWLQKNTAAPKELRAEVQGLYNELSSDVPASRLQEIATRLNQIQAEASAAGKTGKSFADSLKHSFGNLARYLMSFASFYRIIGVIRKAITTVKELDTALMEVRKVSTESFSSLKQWQKLSFKQADEVGGSAVQIEKSTAAWLRLGKSFEEAQEAAQASVKLLNVSEFTNIDDATTSLVSMRQAFQDLTYEDFIDKLNGVGDNFSSSTDQLAQGMKNVSSVLKVAGNDIDQSLALLTAANDITQDMSKASMGVRTVALRISGTQDAKDQLEQEGEDVSDFIVQTQSKVDAQVRKYTATATNPGGISVLDNNGRLRDTYDVLLDIAKVWDEIVKTDDKFGTNRSNGLLELLAGRHI